jgi:hypothetical protein
MAKYGQFGNYSGCTDTMAGAQDENSFDLASAKLLLSQQERNWYNNREKNKIVT